MQFLIIHMHGLGDMIMFAPAFNKLPNKKRYIDVIIFENNAISPILNSTKIRDVYYCNSSYFKFFKIIIKLMSKKYTKIFFSNNSSPLKSLLISIFLNSKNIKIISEKKLNLVNFNETIITVNKNLHKVYRNLLLLQIKSKEKNIDTTLHFKKIRVHKKYFLKKQNINIGFHPGSNIKNGDKRWSLKKYFKLIKFFEKKNYFIYIFIGEYEKDLFKKFNIESKRIKIIRYKPFNHIASLISKLNLFVSNETGLAHLASALGTKTIVVINNTEKINKTKISTPIKNCILIKKTSKNQDLFKIISLSKKILN